MKHKRTYIVLVAMLVAMTLIAYYTPSEVDWTPTYASSDKIPYGDYILYEQMVDIFPGTSITRADDPFYNFDQGAADSLSNYIILCDELKADALDVSHMASYAAAGNDIFIAAGRLPQQLTDTLGIDLQEIPHIFQSDSADYVADFSDEKLKAKTGYHFKLDQFTFRIRDADSAMSNLFTGDTSSQRSIVHRSRYVLGQDAKGNPNFVRIPFGKGNFFIHCFPLAFTNYNMLKKDNSIYVSKCLSYMPVRPTYWDEYYKPYSHTKPETPLRFILSVPAYRWALYTMLFTILLYMLFASKRLQRIIPILLPPGNLSLIFTRTIGTLYYQQKDHKDIAVKKMIYFLEKIRQHYYMQTATTDALFRARLVHKSNADIETINTVFDIYEKEIRRVTYVTEPVLIRFNTALEKFYLQSGLINK